MSELEFVAKYAPAILTMAAVVVLIAYTKKVLFTDMVPKKLFDEQVAREHNFAVATTEAAGHLEEIGRQLEGLSRKQSEEIKQQSIVLREALTSVSERLRTLELVFSDNIDAIRELSIICEKHWKNIPDTEIFQTRKKQP